MLAGDVDTDFSHDLNREWVNLFGCPARAINALSIAGQMPRKSLGHLAATGVAAAEKQGSFRILLHGDSGQKHAPSGALVDGAFDLEFAAMSLNDVFYDSETQSRAAQFAGTRFVDAVEALGEPRQVLFRNPCAGIDDCDFNLRVCCSTGMGVC